MENGKLSANPVKAWKIGKMVKVVGVKIDKIGKLAINLQTNYIK